MKHWFALCILSSPIALLAAVLIFAEVMMWQVSRNVFLLTNASLVGFVLLIVAFAWAINAVDE